jgi:hypothetical protein
VLKQCPTRTVACHHSDTADTDTWPIRDVSGDLGGNLGLDLIPYTKCVTNLQDQCLNLPIFSVSKGRLLSFSMV